MDKTYQARITLKQFFTAEHTAIIDFLFEQNLKIQTS